MQLFDVGALGGANFALVLPNSIRVEGLSPYVRPSREGAVAGRRSVVRRGLQHKRGAGRSLLVTANRVAKLG